MLANLLKSGKLVEGSYACGKTKARTLVYYPSTPPSNLHFEACKPYQVFMKTKASSNFEMLREEAFILQAVKVQACFRKSLFKTRFKNM